MQENWCVRPVFKRVIINDLFKYYVAEVWTEYRVVCVKEGWEFDIILSSLLLFTSHVYPQVTPVSDRDFGRYNCTARNNIGARYQEFILAQAGMCSPSIKKVEKGKSEQVLANLYYLPDVKTPKITPSAFHNPV